MDAGKFRWRRCARGCAPRAAGRVSSEWVSGLLDDEFREVDVGDQILLEEFFADVDELQAESFFVVGGSEAVGVKIGEIADDPIAKGDHTVGDDGLGGFVLELKGDGQSQVSWCARFIQINDEGIDGEDGFEFVNRGCDRASGCSVFVGVAARTKEEEGQSAIDGDEYNAKTGEEKKEDIF